MQQRALPRIHRAFFADRLEMLASERQFESISLVFYNLNFKVTGGAPGTIAHGESCPSRADEIDFDRRAHPA
jgi:hypothetical protein